MREVVGVVDAPSGSEGDSGSPRKARSQFPIFSDCDCDSSSHSKWVAQDSMINTWIFLACSIQWVFF